MEQEKLDFIFNQPQKPSKDSSQEKIVIDPIGTLMSSSDPIISADVANLSKPMSQIIKSSHKKQAKQGKSNTKDKKHETQLESNASSQKLDEFVEYAKLVTNDSRLVFECIEGYKLVIYNDGDKVIEIEHYYEFKTMADATVNLQKIQSKYKDNQYYNGLVQEKNKIKVLFSSSTYGDKTINEIKDIYNNISAYKQV